ncbi:MAG: molybdenum cofactor biosynthesis protein B [Planctomycetota bacterium]
MLSRASAGVVDGRIVFALPGSPKALSLAMDSIILKEAGHLVSQVRG